MISIDLSGRVTLVTGAGGELGRAIARTLAACGAPVAIHFHTSEDKARALREEIVATGGRAEIFQGDITQLEDVRRLREEIGVQLGEPEIVVLNAVSRYEWRTVLDQPVEDFEGQFRSSLVQGVLLAQTFAPAMIASRRGRFIAISTECALQCAPGQGAYVSGKHGLNAMLRVLAREVGEHGITVNQVAPGWTISDKDRAANSEIQPDYEHSVPLRRRGEDTDIANAVAFLASDLAGFISGAFLPVCGGNAMTAI